MTMLRPCYLVALAAVAACGSPVRPDATKLAVWTTELRAKQPQAAFGSVYRRGSTRLVFVGADHTEALDSLTFRMIGEAYASFDIDVAIVEGPARSRGPNSERLLKWVAEQKQREGRQEGGEIIPAVRGAVAEGAVVWGGEPDDRQIRDSLVEQGMSTADVLGFYTLRSIPQWLNEQKITSAGDVRTAALIEAELARNRERLELPSTVLPGYAAWAEWYQRTNGKVFGDDFQLEETGPLADGRYTTNKVAAAISRSRGVFLLEAIAHHINAGESVLVVFGKSHLMIQRPALDAMLGPACYLGSELTEASRRGC